MYLDVVMAIEQGHLDKYSKEEIVEMIKKSFIVADEVIKTSNSTPVTIGAMKMANIFQSQFNLNKENK